MNEQRSSASEAIWIGLCVLLLLVAAAAGGFGFVQHRRAALLADQEMLSRREAERELQAQHALTDMATRLSLKVRELEDRVGELEDENHDLRTQLNPSTP